MKGSSPSAPRTAAVIVAYESPATLRALLKTLSAQTLRPTVTIVVDNSEDDAVSDLLATEFPDVACLHDGVNRGSAGGYATGLAAALERDARYIWTLDDDALPEPPALENLLRGFHDAAQDPAPKLGALRCVGAMHDRRAPEALETISWRGTLFDAAAVREAGLPDRELFLYADDLDYSLRLAGRGYVFRWRPDAVCCEQREDGKNVYRIFGRNYRTYSSSERLYYAFRNELAVSLRHRSWRRALKVLWYAVKLCACLMAFETRPVARERMHGIREGIADGLKGKLGKTWRR